jgi:hypothetical protein
VKIAIEQVQECFALLSGGQSSVRQLAKDLGVNKSTLIYRLKQLYGEDYISHSKGLDGSLLKVVRQDIQPYLNATERLEFRVWVDRNIEALAAPTGLLTNSQLDRLTSNETHKGEDYRGLLDRWTLDSPGCQYESIQIQDAFVPAPPTPKSIKSSYVQQSDLLEVLSQFYDGQLDNCDRYLDRFYLSVEELNPSNSLWSQLDSDDVQSALKVIGDESAALLEYHFTRTDTTLERVHHYYFQSNHSTLNDYLVYQTPEALNRLSDQILKLL